MDNNKHPYQPVNLDLHEINRQQPSYVGQQGAPPPADPTVTQNMAMPPGFPIIPQPVGPKSAEMTCPHCRCRIRTRIDHRSTAKTHIACLLLACTFCCCLPYCMDSCRNTNHFCPMCGAYIGTYAS